MINIKPVYHNSTFLFEKLNSIQKFESLDYSDCYIWLSFDYVLPHPTSLINLENNLVVVSNVYEDKNKTSMQNLEGAMCK